MYDDEDYLVECMEVGGSGYVLKDSPAPQLLAAIRDVYRGGSYLSPKMLSQLVDDFRSRMKMTHRQPRFATLTPREKQILKFLAEGQTVKDIATHLNLSVKTIEAHKFNLMRKLDIHNKARLVQYAIRKKIIRIPIGPLIPRPHLAAATSNKPNGSSQALEALFPKVTGSAAG